ncbi:hypothetical protein XELAEV_18026926mg [Xenopus laevis]|uniref:Uncharacterized protein n=1 Tax=Xenopus laevis TaxID=8355 RepID=A0A974HJH1_XENLA|nr:hypothetical protein XELAEV_18026926mg [Xenopus laevis]
MGSEDGLQTLPFTGPRPGNDLPNTILSTYKCWQIVARKAYLNTNQWSPAMPLWHNRLLGQFLQIPDPSIWTNKGVTELRHILLENVLKTFDHLKREYDLPNHYLFQYLQLKHAFSAQFPGNTVQLREPGIEKLLKLEELHHLTSILYGGLMDLMPDPLAISAISG